MTRKRSLTLGSQFMDYERVSVYYGTNKQKELSEEQSESAAAETKYAAYQCKNRQAFEQRRQHARLRQCEYRRSRGDSRIACD